MKVYVLIQPFGSYEDSGEKIIGVYKDKKLALADMGEIEKKTIIPSDKVFTIIPQNVYYDWPFDENTDEYINEYKGYTLDEYHKQGERVDVYNWNFGLCRIEEYELICENKE